MKTPGVDERPLFTVAIGYMAVVRTGYTASASALPSTQNPAQQGHLTFRLCDYILRNGKLYWHPPGAFINLPAYPQSGSTSETVLSFPLAYTERTILNAALALSQQCSVGIVQCAHLVISLCLVVPSTIALELLEFYIHNLELLSVSLPACAHFNFAAKDSVCSPIA